MNKEAKATIEKMMNCITNEDEYNIQQEKLNLLLDNMSDDELKESLQYLSEQFVKFGEKIMSNKSEDLTETQLLYIEKNKQFVKTVVDADYHDTVASNDLMDEIETMRESLDFVETYQISQTVYEIFTPLREFLAKTQIFAPEANSSNAKH